MHQITDGQRVSNSENDLQIKKIKIIFVALLLVIAAVFPLWASFDDPPVEYTASQKLVRGLVNVSTCFLEIPREVTGVSTQEGLDIGWTYGFIRGFAITGARLGAGLIDTLTFPFEFPKRFKEPLILPEFAWEEGRTFL